MSTGTQGSDSRRRWMRVAVVMVCSLVILAGVFVFTLENNDAVASVTSQVRDAFARHLSDFTSENATVLTADYEPGATVIWTGNARTWGGSYSNATIIHEFFSLYYSVYTTISVHNATYTVQAVGSGATVNGSLDLLGLAVNGNSMTASVVTQAVYAHVDGQWVISSETWSFVTFFINRPFD